MFVGSRTLYVCNRLVYGALVNSRFFFVALSASVSGWILRNLFCVWNRKEVRFSTGQKSHHVAVRCATLWWFCDFYFSWGNQQENQSKLRIELHVTKRSDTRRVERSNGMRHLLWNCVRLVAGSARSSRSQRAWPACGGPTVVVRTRTRVIVFIVSSIYPREDTKVFSLCSAVGCCWEATTQEMAAKVILSLIPSLSFHASRCTGVVSQLCIRVANA